MWPYIIYYIYYVRNIRDIVVETSFRISFYLNILLSYLSLTKFIVWQLNKNEKSIWNRTISLTCVLNVYQDFFRIISKSIEDFSEHVKLIKK